ncbi:patatin-like phospholipase family protein [Arcticibacterium luteifluviistationis]|uniref:Patatin n=1 Tax=Arcticibacterium luteifluviistationis TaxID=1784714 RepID=A0A2Z4GGG2_9BACT|nr:patatin-like phospholipase family protein [Arcticibacterium luteifluviistationis]AWW00168.1 patatin [Arcticibacterium luteifluviistationis]
MNFTKNFLLVLLLASTTTFGQKYEYRNLVMEGGGIKGIAYGGAMLELEEKGILKDIVRVAGTSAGAIQASLLAIGYSASEISEIIANTPVESFNDDGFISRGTKRLFNDFGWFKGDSFLATMEDLIFERTGSRNLTFKDLHHLSTTYPFRDLYVVGANLSEQKSVIFSHETYPNMRVADAVRISMSIPIYYKALWVNPDGKIMEAPTPEDNCHLFVDGGILMNYPIEIFDNTRFLNKQKTNEEHVFNKETIGFRLDRMEQINQEVTNGSGIAPYEITDFNSYVSALSSILMRNVNPAHPEDVHRTIFINDLGMSPRVRKILPDEKKLMMDSGRKGVKDFLTRTNLVTD